MKNPFFDITFDAATGNMISIVNPRDPHGMNWCSHDCQWGAIKMKTYPHNNDFDGELYPAYQNVLKQFEADEAHARSVYQNEDMQIVVTRYFNEEGNLIEHFKITNMSDTVIPINGDNMGVCLPFNDEYTYADECLTNKCHTHIWCGHNVTWVNALKMGPSDVNLGLLVRKGAFDFYSQNTCHSNHRGYFELNPESVLLKSRESYEIEWKLFWHTGKDDFFSKLTSDPSYIGIKAAHYTVFQGEPIVLDISCRDQIPAVFCDGAVIPVQNRGNGYRVHFQPKRTGEHRFYVSVGGRKTFADFMVKTPFEKLYENRLRFMVENQQCRDKESPLYGAFLIFDNETNAMYFNDRNSDHNASRERLNMGFALIRYLQFKENKIFREALDKYIAFLYREIYEETTGEVFNTIGKNRNCIRLYNAPGFMLIFSEMYKLTKNKKYIDDILKLAEHYYSIDGHKCYSNAVAVKKVLSVIRDADMPEAYQTMLGYFKKHVNYMIENGTSYPKHECNYEQTIVTPAVNCISEMGLFDDSQNYAEIAREHILCLERFNGNQPSYHLNEIAIRYWDDYWFGKSRLFGDTLPHHLSALTARAYGSYYRLTGEKVWIERAEECLRNTLCLIEDEGRGHAACVYPHAVNGRTGHLMDQWNNDQDLPLYEATYLSDLIDCFSL